ncbi:hypothetical protein B0H17DRAFT_1087082 [Mycena rosella]|uniref:Uncharacterized protein n=1 Tax=Mycena rosella TaxID=1033263 RepID=A0AAD7CY32_MYCRO|nr:hypothetical protein B0H17DRAFT_1087082 [Mycena rosella]
MNPPTATEIYGALRFQSELQGHFSFTSAAPSLVHLISTFGPSPGIIFRAMASDKMIADGPRYQKLLNDIATLRMSCPWRASAELSIGGLPAGVMTTFRHREYYKARVMFSSRRVQDMFFKALRRAGGSSFLLRQYYWLNRDEPNLNSPLAWQSFEGIAYDFLCDSFRCEFRWCPMLFLVTTPRAPGNKQTVHAKIVGQYSVVPIQIREPEIRESEFSVYTRPGSTKRPQPEDGHSESPRPRKSQKLSNTGDSGQSASADEADEALILPPVFPKRTFFDPSFRGAIEPDVLYIPTARTTLFDAIAHHAGCGYLYKMCDNLKSADGVHRIAPAGIAMVQAMLPFDTPVVFVAVVPMGKKGSLMMPADSDAQHFDAWKYYSLELLIPRPKPGQD